MRFIILLFITILTACSKSELSGSLADGRWTNANCQLTLQKVDASHYLVKDLLVNGVLRFPEGVQVEYATEAGVGTLNTTDTTKSFRAEVHNDNAIIIEEYCGNSSLIRTQD